MIRRRKLEPIAHATESVYMSYDPRPTIIEVQVLRAESTSSGRVGPKAHHTLPRPRSIPNALTPVNVQARKQGEEVRRYGLHTLVGELRWRSGQREVRLRDDLGWQRKFLERVGWRLGAVERRRDCVHPDRGPADPGNKQLEEVRTVAVEVMEGTERHAGPGRKGPTVGGKVPELRPRACESLDVLIIEACNRILSGKSEGAQVADREDGGDELAEGRLDIERSFVAMGPRREFEVLKAAGGHGIVEQRQQACDVGHCETRLRFRGVYIYVRTFQRVEAGDSEERRKARCIPAHRELAEVTNGDHVAKSGPRANEGGYAQAVEARFHCENLECFESPTFRNLDLP